MARISWFSAGEASAGPKWRVHVRLQNLAMFVRRSDWSVPWLQTGDMIIIYYFIFSGRRRILLLNNVFKVHATETSREPFLHNYNLDVVVVVADVVVVVVVVIVFVVSHREETWTFASQCHLTHCECAMETLSWWQQFTRRRHTIVTYMPVIGSTNLSFVRFHKSAWLAELVHDNTRGRTDHRPQA